MTIFGKLVYSKYGEPANELAFATEHRDQAGSLLQPGQIRVRALYSPVHRSDLATIKGHFPVKPPLPAVPGSEGVVQVIQTPNTGTTLKQGDHAIVINRNWGLWKQEGTIEDKFLYKIDPKLPLEAAATLITNPCTAYLLVKHLVELKPGDFIIQNAANSAVGQLVIQFAKMSGLHTINVVRNRPNLHETVDLLKTLGADFVITNEQLAKGAIGTYLELPRPKLAFECIGGHVGADLAASLDNGGTMVVYGVISGQPVQLRQEDLIFRNIRVIGFWLTKWREEHSEEEFRNLLTQIEQHYLCGMLQMPKFRKFQLSQWREAIEHATRGHTNEKVLLHLDENGNNDRD